jgi:hypothetical protein
MFVLYRSNTDEERRLLNFAFVVGVEIASNIPSDDDPVDQEQNGWARLTAKLSSGDRVTLLVSRVDESIDAFGAYEVASDLLQALYAALADDRPCYDLDEAHHARHVEELAAWAYRRESLSAPLRRRARKPKTPVQ